MTKRKSIFTIMFSFVLMLCCACIFTACGITPNDDNNDNNNDAGEYQTDTLNSATQIKTAIGDTYYITVEVSASSSEDVDETFIYTIVSDGTWFYGVYGNTDTVYLVERNESNYTVYLYDEETDSYVYDDTYQDVDETEYASYFDMGYLFAGSMFGYTSSIDYTSKQNKTFLGRAAVEYTQTESYSIPGYGSYQYSDVVIIDNATGACLKHSISGSASAGGEHASGSYAFECKKFVVGSNTEITTTLAAQQAKIAANQD